MSIITGADLGEYMGIPDTGDTTTLDRAAAAASMAVNQFCDRTFETTALVDASPRLYWPSHGSCELTVDDFWDTTVLTVAVDTAGTGTYTTALVLNTDYYLEPLNGLRYGEAWPYTTIVLLNRTFPAYSSRPSVRVTAAWGWATIPAGVTQAALIKGHKLANRSQSPEGVLGGFTDYGAVRISRFEDPDVVHLLTPYSCDTIHVA